MDMVQADRMQIFGTSDVHGSLFCRWMVCQCSVPMPRLFASVNDAASQ